ncbi:MAG: hypothetical protein GY754_24860, partial [bacterium]|nr:hypothetical protein [bacterium]
MPNLPKPTGPGDRKAKNYVDRVIISNNVLTGWRTYVWYDPRLLDEAGNPEMAAHFAGAARVELKSIIEFE